MPEQAAPWYIDGRHPDPMEIDPNLKPGGLPRDASPAEVRNWRVGQVLNAVATSADRGGRADLRIGGQTFQAQVPFTVRPGDRMMLEVIRTGTTPLLRPVGAERSPDPVQAALRTALPRQGTLPPVLANVAQLATSPSPPPVPTPVTEAARALFQHLSTPRQTATAEGLRQAVQNAGGQLEARLAQAASGRPDAAALRGDFKAGLLRLREAVNEALRQPPPAPTRGSAPAPTPSNPIPMPQARTMPLATQAPTAAQPPAAGRPTITVQAPQSAAAGASTANADPRTAPPLLPPLAANQPQAQGRAAPFPLLLEPAKLLQGLLHQVDSSLARLQLHQLASQPTDGDQRQVWLLELPIRRDQTVDVMHLRIERETEGAGSERDRRGNGWTVKLAFDLDGLGPVQARVGLHGGMVSAAFWTERSSTLELFQRHLAELRRQLQAAGLDVGAIRCEAGPAPHSRDETKPVSGILDERA